MASKKKNPSFEIPDAVRRAGQSGWVYRSDAAKGRPHRPAAAVPPLSGEPEAPVTAQADRAGDAWAVSTSVIELGLHVVAVPFVVPLYITAAISRKLGLLPR